jgi:hypothetical protein
MENITAQNIELAIWRSGLVSPKTRPYALESACKAVRNAARKLDRQRLNMCNGVMQPDGFMGWSQEDQDKAEKTIANCQDIIESELKGVLVRGLVYDFRSDPRAPVLRVVNKDNTRDFWIG